MAKKQDGVTFRTPWSQEQVDQFHAQARAERSRPRATGLLLGASPAVQKERRAYQREKESRENPEHYFGIDDLRPICPDEHEITDSGLGRVVVQLFKGFHPTENSKIQLAKQGENTQFYSTGEGMVKLTLERVPSRYGGVHEIIAEGKEALTAMKEFKLYAEIRPIEYMAYAAMESMQNKR